MYTSVPKHSARAKMIHTQSLRTISYRRLWLRSRFWEKSLKDSLWGLQLFGHHDSCAVILSLRTTIIPLMTWNSPTQDYFLLFHIQVWLMVTLTKEITLVLALLWLVKKIWCENGETAPKYTTLEIFIDAVLRINKNVLRNVYIEHRNYTERLLQHCSLNIWTKYKLHNNGL